MYAKKATAISAMRNWRRSPLAADVYFEPLHHHTRRKNVLSDKDFIDAVSYLRRSVSRVEPCIFAAAQ
jgi:hypothetical protein